MESRIILLQVFDKAKEIAELCFETGAVQIVAMPTVEQAYPTPLHGFLVEERGYSKSVYAYEGKLYLQIGRQRWDVNQPGFRILLKRLSWKKNRVRVESSEETVFSEKYPSALTDQVNAADPTFDGMDEESCDFWLWLSRCASDPNWRTGVLKLWSQGFRWLHRH